MSSSQSPSNKLDELFDSSARIEELSSASEDEIAQQKAQEKEQGGEETDESSNDEDDGQNVHGWMANKVHTANLPHLFAHPSILQDTLVTETSEKQQKVMRDVLDILTNTDEAQEIHERNSHGLPRLQRLKHIKFLRQVLGNYPPPYQAMDASRPWLLYWALAGLTSLGVDVSGYKERTIQTFAPMQNPDGGFGGGHGQLSHCAASYAATLSLAMVDGLDMIDRKTMWAWLGSVKQGDGSFTMAIGGEKDVRGAYCGLTIHTLLNLPLTLPPNSPARASGLETFTDSLGSWLGSCQSYEGGIGSATTNEAHGAYAFCCLAALCLLDAPYRSIPKYLNLPRLLSWLSSRQSAPEGSFTGRTNKLVDACYSHWVGGCWSLIEAAVSGPSTSHPSTTKTNREENATILPHGLWSREGLIRYSLACSQTKKGGLRDKPGTRPDGYHTCYSLAGLSAAQNHYLYEEPSEPHSHTDVEGLAPLTAAFNWRAEKASLAERKVWCFDESDTVRFVHPVFVMPMEAVERTRRQFEGRVGF